MSDEKPIETRGHASGRAFEGLYPKFPPVPVTNGPMSPIVPAFEQQPPSDREHPEPVPLAESASPAAGDKKCECGKPATFQVAEAAFCIACFKV